MSAQAISIPFNRPFATGKELGIVHQAIDRGHLSGDGPFTRQCHAWLEERVTCRKALLTHSCTAALEMSAILADLQPGDEVIMPSFTFVSTANAFVLRGAVPVFVDIRPDTLNLDVQRAADAITTRTRAIVPVHYAGVSCDMDALMTLADRAGLLVIEDAAQGLLCTHRQRPVGSVGHLAALSFHETKVVMSGEGGALLINDPRWIQRAEIIREKGTNRSQFFRGEVAKYSWMDIGSSYLPSEITAAFLWAQFEEAGAIVAERQRLWRLYHDGLAALEAAGRLRRPVVPEECEHNGHMYYLLLPQPDLSSRVLARLKERGIHAVFHYVPLHSSPGGRRYGRGHGEFSVTDSVSARLIRLPLWVGMTDAMIERVVEAVADAC
jgi:dTDP-4-amino-4,6-dideoxygalactose transaminase